MPWKVADLNKTAFLAVIKGDFLRLQTIPTCRLQAIIKYVLNHVLRPVCYTQLSLPMNRNVEC